MHTTHSFRSGQTGRMIGGRTLLFRCVQAASEPAQLEVDHTVADACGGLAQLNSKFKPVATFVGTDEKRPGLPLTILSHA